MKEKTKLVSKEHKKEIKKRVIQKDARFFCITEGCLSLIGFY